MTRSEAAKPSGRRKGQLGFALLSVVAMTAVLASFASVLVYTAFIEAKTKANIARRATLELAAEAGVNLAILRLVDWSQTGDTSALEPYRAPSGHSCTVADVMVTAWILDETGKIDLNAASLELLARLFAGLGADSRSAEALAAAVIAFRALPDGSTAVQGPFVTVDELHQVEGMPARLAQAARPFVTVHSGLAAFDPFVASPALLQLLSKGGELTDMHSANSYQRRFAVQALAEFRPGAMASIQAIVELRPDSSEAYRLLEWTPGVLPVFEPSATSRTAEC